MLMEIIVTSYKNMIKKRNYKHDLNGLYEFLLVRYLINISRTIFPSVIKQYIFRDGQPISHPY